jgi:DNA-binding NarL/FixJ family response regulator
MDLDMPGMNGVECTRRIKAALPGVRVVVLTVFEERATIIEAICAGADGYLLKRTSADDLLMQLRSVMAGGSPLSAGVARTVLEVVRQVNERAPARVAGSGPPIDLTGREREVLACLVRGMSYKAVAGSLNISIDTVRSHIRVIYGKLQVHSVAEAVGRALRNGLV